MMAFDLEALRDVLRDDKLHIMLGLVKRVAVADDRSLCRVLVSILPEQRELIAEMSWEAVGQDCGVFLLPAENDLVLVGQAEGDKELAYVIRRLTSADEKIPVNAAAGDLVLKARPQTRAWLTGQTVQITAGDQAGAENLVLGQQLKTLLGQILQLLSTHTHVGNLGAPTSAPQEASQFSDLKSNFVENETILSSIAFTEKGS